MAESVACIPSGLIWGYIAYKGESLPGFFHAHGGQCGTEMCQYWDDLISVNRGLGLVNWLETVR